MHTFLGNKWSKAYFVANRNIAIDTGNLDDKKFYFPSEDWRKNARFKGDKHRPRNWVFPTLKVKKNLVRNGLHVDHYDM